MIIHVMLGLFKVLFSIFPVYPVFCIFLNLYNLLYYSFLFFCHNDWFKYVKN